MGEDGGNQRHPGPDAPRAPGGLGGRVVRGSAWSTGSYMLREGMRLGGNVLLARLLAPEIFGLMALVNAFRMGLGMVSDVGLAPSVIRSPRGDEPAFLATAWTVQILRGVLLFALAGLAAIPLAQFYGQPELAKLLPVAAFTLVLGGFNATSLLRMRRHLDLPRLEAIEIASQAAGLALMVGWVLVDPTIWALVFGGWAASGVRLLLSHVLADRRDHLGWEGPAARELFGFGAWILVSTLLTFVADQADRLLLGRLVPLDTLGVYSIAAMFAALPATLVSRLGNTVVFPALSRKLEAGSQALHPAFQRAQRLILVAGGVLVAAGAAAAPSGIAFLYDARYQDAGWMIPLLAVGAWWRVLAIPKGSVLLALGESRAVAGGNGAKTAALLLGMPAGFALGGLPGAIAGLVLADLARFVAMTMATMRHGVMGLGPELAATAAVVASAAAGLLLARGLPAPALVQALAAAALVMTLWSPFLWRVARREGWVPSRTRP